MKRSLKALLLAGVASTAIIAPQPVPAAIPVIDELANAQWVVQLSNGVKELAYWSQQIKAMVELITLQNIMNTVLGEGLGTAFTDLLNSTQALYDSGSGLYYSIANMQARLTGEMGLFMPPYDTMTTQQMLTRAKRISEFTTQNNAKAAMWQARAIDKANLALQQAQAGTAQSARAVSAVSAVQAANHILAAQSYQLDAIGKTAALLATNIEQQLMRQNTSEGMVQAQAQKDLDAMAAAMGAGQAMPGISPSSWR